MLCRQETGEFTGQEPTATLRKFRSGAQLGFEGEKDVFFGQNMLHENKGTVHVGDTLHILSFKKPPKEKKQQ